MKVIIIMIVHYIQFNCDLSGTLQDEITARTEHQGL